MPARSDEPLETVAGFGADRVSGSVDVARGFLDALERWSAADGSRTAVALRSNLLAWLRSAQAAQPTMALVHQLAARALETADAGVERKDGPAELRAAIAHSCAAERADLVAQRDAVGRLAAALVTERDGWIATLSDSGTVRAALEQAHSAGMRPHALVAESRPRCEGRALAAALAAAGVPTWVVVDAALPLLASGARMVWLGADAVTDRGVVNKVGSYALALAARDHSVPVYVLAGRRKFIPAATPALKILEMPPDEVLPDPPAGVRARNVYFELVPLELVRGVVVEDGVLGASEARMVAIDRPLPEPLARG